MTEAQILANSKAIESETVSFNNTNPTEADYQALCKGVALKTTANVYIAFDRPANTNDFLLIATDGVVELDHDWKFTKISALGASGSGTLYTLVRR